MGDGVADKGMRIETEGGGAAGEPPAGGPAWGWGPLPGAASGRRRDDAARALAELPADPRDYSARQQVAARRALGAQLGSYEGYTPEPFVE